MAMGEGGVVKIVEGISSMFRAGRNSYYAGLTLGANPWDGNNPSEARPNWSWRKGFASAERDTALLAARGRS